MTTIELWRTPAGVGWLRFQQRHYRLQRSHRHVVEQLRDVRASPDSAERPPYLATPARPDAKPDQCPVVWCNVAATRVRMFVGDCFGGNDLEPVVKRDPHPHIVHGIPAFNGAAETVFE